jgi:hypothetical protein
VAFVRLPPWRAKFSGLIFASQKDFARRVAEYFPAERNVTGAIKPLRQHSERMPLRTAINLTLALSARRIIGPRI